MRSSIFRESFHRFDAKPELFQLLDFEKRTSPSAPRIRDPQRKPALMASGEAAQCNREKSKYDGSSSRWAFFCERAAFRRLHHGAAQRRDFLLRRCASGTFPSSSLADREHRTCQKVSTDPLPERSESMERGSRKQTNRRCFPGRGRAGSAPKTKTWER